MKVLIVSRTRMGGYSRCIGGIDTDSNNAPVRLLRADGSHYPSSSLMQIGQVWDLGYVRPSQPRPPHVEDVLVSSEQFVGTVSSLSAELLARAPAWGGGINSVLGGRLGYTSNNNGYISPSDVPPQSTGFWIPDQDLSLRDDGKHYDYSSGMFSVRGLKYVGEPEPIATIPAKTWVRISLARWWKPEGADDDFEERCYAQLSGWY